MAGEQKSEMKMRHVVNIGQSLHLRLCLMALRDSNRGGFLAAKSREKIFLGYKAKCDLSKMISSVL